ncbi:MAG: hypothetical protein IPG70_09580 [Moraxellaceae bacterium]|nr:hypothetical protein [Moraxellaceae bacterium]
MIIKDPNDYYRIKGAVALKQIIDDAITAHNAGIKQMFDDAQNEKAVPPSEDGTAPNSDNVASESIADGAMVTRVKVISHMDDLGHKKSQPTVLIEMADDCELFHTSDDEAYAVVKTPTSRQVFAVRSAQVFRRYLSQRYFKLFGKGVGNQALQDALITIEAKANFNGTLRQVYKRVANLGDRIYLDLCDEKWRVIEVTAAGWQVLNCSPVMFTRTKRYAIYS